MFRPLPIIYTHNGDGTLQKYKPILDCEVKDGET